MIDWKAVQQRIGVASDGIPGRDTFTAIFRTFGAGPERAAELALAANVRLREYGLLESRLRLAHFLAQLIHESGSFRYMEEIASGAAYEGRKDLGNVLPGDGKRYKGRGPIQLTGRANYRAFGQRIGIALENHPQIAAVPSIGLWIACEYWKSRDLNVLADKNEIEAITRKINGGVNGLADRKAAFARVWKVLV